MMDANRSEARSGLTVPLESVPKISGQLITLRE
jgi:hypothetical protein